MIIILKRYKAGQATKKSASRYANGTNDVLLALPKQEFSLLRLISQSVKNSDLN